MKEKNIENHFKKYHGVKSKLLIGDIKRKPCEYGFLIPAYRNPKCLERAINSIYNQKNCPEFDLIVVDDSGEMMRDMHVLIEKYAESYDNIYYYLNEKNLGLFGNWNRCYELSRNTYCCFLNHDDELKPNYLQRVSEIMSTGKFDSVRVGNNIIHNNVITNSSNWFDRKYFNCKGYIQIPSWFYFLYRGGFPPSGTCIRRNCVIELGGYDETYYPASDYEFDARLASKFRVGILWERLCNIYTDQSTSMKKETIVQSIKISYKLDMRVYNDIYHLNHKYDWIAGMRFWKRIKATGIRYECGVDKKYNRLFYRIAYAIFYRFCILMEIVSSQFIKQ